jgi:hypothetical protein
LPWHWKIKAPSATLFDAARGNPHLRLFVARDSGGRTTETTQQIDIVPVPRSDSEIKKGDNI